MSEEQHRQAAEAFWTDADGLEQQAEAMALLARQLKARPRFVQSLSTERKARYLAAYPGMPDLLAARLLVSYHLAHQRPLMAAFLDALGIPHEDGLIGDEVAGPIAAERLATAAKSLAGRFPPEDVTRYFATLVAQDPETWNHLEALV
jgi:hypothetical protein